MMEYDTGPGAGKTNIADLLLVDIKFHLDKGSEELVLRDPNKAAFKRAKKQRTDWQTSLRRMPICAEMRDSWNIQEEREGNVDDDEQENTQPIEPEEQKREQERKK